MIDDTTGSSDSRASGSSSTGSLTPARREFATGTAPALAVSGVATVPASATEDGDGD